MKDLPDNPTLGDFQSHLRELVLERNFDKETVPEVFMLFLEEAGEFAKATRKAHGMKVDSASKVHDLEEEAADVFWLLLDLCNRLGIDLEKAFRAKEEINKKRTWT